MSQSRGWGWVDHLRSGGTTPWSSWIDTSAPRGPRLPSAQHLELLRRVNEASHGRPAPALVERLLAAPTTGRGRGDLTLSGEGDHPPYGPAPVDPGALTPRDVLPVAAAALAGELVRTGAPRNEPAPLRRVRVERRLGRVRRVTVVAGPYDAVLADAWAVACFSGTVPPWHRWLQRAQRRDGVPPRADLVGVADHWARQFGADRVVVDMRPGGSALPVPLAGSAAGAALARQVRLALSVSVAPDVRGVLLRGPLLHWLAELPAGTAAPAAVPDPLRAWVDRAAHRQRDALVAAGYDFAGDPDLLPSASARGTAPTAESALDLAVQLLVRRRESL